VVNAIPSRPRGIKLKTYGRLCARINRLERAWPLVASGVMAPRWFARSPVDLGTF
jgi:hypothetical protein